MTDKQIIERLKKDLSFERTKRKSLQADLKAKEQELQQAMDNYVQLDLQRVKEYNELVDLYKAKEQECKELKHKVELMMDCVSCKVDEYKQTLTEIKEIAEEEIECKTYEIENDCFNKTRCKALNEHIDFIKQIIQKISECEIR